MLEPREMGFEGYAPLRALPRGCQELPPESGVYCVLTEDPKPEFVETSAGGWFKGRDPSVDLDQIEAKWVNETSILYIGKAKSLRKRIDQFARFGRGEPIGHWGGRYLWQLANPDDLQIAWKIDPNPAQAEIDLISNFVEVYDTLPFANLNRPRRAGRPA
ncbi:MAG: hypothetical protein KDB66_09775 [Solirubrobacterales bacterium]|nr:hypothetical protein [Solirubrobacterales bacterium]MCB8916199.1 hypothetical protein [Thermoleophilales bacterium]